MTQNTLLTFFSKKCSNPAFSKFNLLTFLLFISPSQYLWAILYPKPSFQRMPWFSLTFLVFLIKIVSFGSSNIVIHVSSNDHFCAGFFSWAAVIVNDYFKCKFLSVAFFQNWLSWVVTMDDSIFLPDQLINTGSFLPVCIPLKDSFLFLWVFPNAALYL